MAKRPQGLHKSAQSKKKQKLSNKPALQEDEHHHHQEADDVQHTDAPGALEFDQEIDPNDELKSLFAMYDETLGGQHHQSGDAGDNNDQKSNPLHQLSQEKISNMIIHSCDNILRMHSQKAEKAKNGEKVDYENKSPIDLLPEVLPAKFHAIYAIALLKMAKILHEQEQEEEDEDSDEEDEGKEAKKGGSSSSSKDTTKVESKHDTSIDFIDAAIERCETGLEGFPNDYTLLFTHAHALVSKVSELADDTSLEAVPTELVEPVTKAQAEYEKAESEVSQQASSTQDWATVYNDQVFSILNTLLGFTNWIGIQCASQELDMEEEEGEDNELGKLLIEKKNQCLSWGLARYENILKQVEASSSSASNGNSKKDTKGKVSVSTEQHRNEELARKAHAGLGAYYITIASPLVEKFEECVSDLPDDDDEGSNVDPKTLKKLEARIEKASKKAITLVQKSVDHFTKAEPEEETAQDDEDAAVENGERFAHTGEALIQLANLTQDEDKQEELYKKAVHKLRLAQRLGAGDFSEQIRDLAVE